MSRSKRGFTLIELLVVIAIIAILIALHNYHDIYKMFPPGQTGTDKWGDNCPEGQCGNWNWAAHILPQIDQAPLFNAIVITRPFDEAVNTPAVLSQMQNSLEAFRCPSDVGPGTNSEHRVPSNNPGSNTDCTNPGCHPVATSNYVGANHSWELNRGDNMFLPGATSGPREQFNGTFGRSQRLGNRTTTIAGKLKQIAIEDMLDGTSNVACVGERAWQLNNVPLRAGVVFGHNGDEPNHNRRGLIYGMAGGRWKLNDTCANCGRGFSSQHEGGAHFLMADGAVRFVSENVDHNIDQQVNSTYERIIAIADNQPVGEF